MIYLQYSDYNNIKVLTPDHGWYDSCISIDDVGKSDVKF